MKQPWLRVDFKNWKDEDDDEEEGGAQGQDLGRSQQTEFKKKEFRSFTKQRLLTLLKGVFAKNERWYRLNAIKKRF